MTILVTGGAGFIGANFIYYEQEKHPEDRIVCLDKLTYAGNLSTLETAMKNPNFRFVRADICDAEAVNASSRKRSPTLSSTSRRSRTSTARSRIRASSCAPTSSARRC